MARSPFRRWWLLRFVLLLLVVILPVTTSVAEQVIVATPVQAEEKPRKGLKLSGIFKRSKKPASQPKIVATPVVQPQKPAHITRKSTNDTLQSLIDEALQNNPELRSARQDQIIQLAESEFTGKDAFPQLAIYGTRETQPHSLFSSRNNQFDRSERNALGLTAEQPLLDWGENRGKVRAERHQAKSHFWNAKVKELDTVYQVTEAYWRLVFFQQTVNLRQRALDAKKREKTSIRARVDAGSARDVELLFADAEVEDAEQELFKARNGYELAEAQLLFYTGRDGCEKVCVRDHLSISAGSDHGNIDIDCHPEMQRVRSAEQAAFTAEKAARAGRLPKVIFRGSIEESNARESAGTTNLVPDGTNYQLGAYISVPAGRQWVAATAKVNEAHARQAQLAADADALNGSLQIRIRNAQNRVEEALKSVTVAEKNEKAAAANYNLRKELALSRNATRADVAKSEKEYNDAKVGILKAKYDVLEARAHLERELGLTCL